jgi:hypothetical protein
VTAGTTVDERRSSPAACVPDRPHVGHHGAHAGGIPHHLLVQEPQRLPPHPGRVAVALVIAPEVGDPGVPAPAVGLEDEAAVGIGGVDRARDGSPPGRRICRQGGGSPPPASATKSARSSSLAAGTAASERSSSTRPSVAAPTAAGPARSRHVATAA